MPQGGLKAKRFLGVKVVRPTISYYDNGMEEKIKGVTVTEEQIEAWANEAEIGYDVTALKKRGRGRPGRGAAPSQVVAVRFTPEEIAEIDKRAKKQKVSRSELIRKAVLT